jgi:UDP-N-acetylmuramoylalanine--D-glutamate ligase
MLNLKDQNIMILGLGESGLSMARWCVLCGANVWVVDDRQEPPHLKTLKEEMPKVQFIQANFQVGVLNAVPVKAVFKSPGLSPAAVQDLWQYAQSQGLSTGTELTLFAMAMNELKQKCLYAPHVVAVTGTNGKTTVTSLTAALLRRAQMKVAVAGNIGPALLDTLQSYLKPTCIESLRDFDFQSLEAEIAKECASSIELKQEEAVNVRDHVFAQDQEVTLDDANPAHLSSINESELPAEIDVTSQDMEPVSGSEMNAPIISSEQLKTQRLLALFPWIADLPQAWVLELSSFQLKGVTEFEPTAATVLNISQDHLDWHADMEDYVQSKAAIFGARTQRVLNRDDPQVMSFVPQAKEKLKPSSLVSKAKNKTPALPLFIEFGFGMPMRAGDFGVEHVNGMSWLVRALADSGLKVKKNQTLEELEIQRLIPVDALRIRGRHNASNALAALALASTTQAKLAPMLYGLREYAGEPHRIQSVQVIEGVEYFDDSKGTNVGATVAALEGLGHERKLVLILGGDAKSQDFTPLIQPINRFARAVILLGRDADLIEKSLALVKIEFFRVQTMHEAVQKASMHAKSSDAVLLSPACSSLDMYKNYAHRGQVFIQAVQALSEVGALEMVQAGNVTGVRT